MHILAMPGLRDSDLLLDPDDGPAYADFNSGAKWLEARDMATVLGSHLTKRVIPMPILMFKDGATWGARKHHSDLPIIITNGLLRRHVRALRCSKRLIVFVPHFGPEEDKERRSGRSKEDDAIKSSVSLVRAGTAFRQCLVGCICHSHACATLVFVICETVYDCV